MDKWFIWIDNKKIDQWSEYAQHGRCRCARNIPQIKSKVHLQAMKHKKAINEIAQLNEVQPTR